MLDGGYDVAVSDISAAALARPREALGGRGANVRWIVGDVTSRGLDLGTVDVWHDRAVFHFLTEPSDRAAYLDLLSRTLTPGGHVVMATFAPEGPEKCSGLPVCRYDAAGLAAELGTHYRLVSSAAETHHTPWGKPQQFTFALFRR